MKGEGKVEKYPFSFINFLLLPPYILLKRSLHMMPVVEIPVEEKACDNTPVASATSTRTASSSTIELISTGFI